MNNYKVDIAKNSKEFKSEEFKNIESAVYVDLTSNIEYWEQELKRSKKDFYKNLRVKGEDLRNPIPVTLKAYDKIIWILTFAHRILYNHEILKKQIWWQVQHYKFRRVKLIETHLKYLRKRNEL